MLDKPKDLSVAEIVQVDGILRSAYAMMMRECYLVVMEIFAECESLAGYVAGNYFSNEYAQMWWRRSHKPISYHSDDIISTIITGLDPSQNRSLK